MRDYQNLKVLLEKEAFPHDFLFKFIGKNSDAFEEGTRQLERDFPDLIMETLKLSQNQNHVSYSYSFQAETAEQIIEIYRAIEKLPDLEILL